MNEDSPLLHAINLYAKITGVDVPSPDGSFRGSSADYDVRQSYDALKEALELDPSEVTANLMLSYYTRRFLGNAKLSMMSLLEDPEAYLAKLHAPRELLAIVSDKDVVDARDAFILKLKQALRLYGADERADVAERLTEFDVIAFLRRDALRGVERLQLHQFLRGEAEAAGYKPVFHKKVFQWWNINSLLAAALTLPSGISLNLIRDRDAYQSYFVFCIRNGGNLYILTDSPEYSHPLQAGMSRRPDRAIASRSCQAWFPYDLLGLKWDEEYERYYIESVDATGIAVYQHEHKILKAISALDPNETIWITMMLDLIVKKFWKIGVQLPELSYTGEMIKIENRLIEQAKIVNLPVVAYQPLEMAALSVADVMTDAVTEDQVGTKAHEPNRWMEERYAARCDSAILNLVEQVGTRVLFPGFQLKWQDEAFTGGTLIAGSDLRRVSATEISLLGNGFAGDEVKRASLEIMDSTKFGTKAELEADRVFVARHNLATQINILAKEEFETRRDEVIGWYVATAKKNLPALLSWCAHEEIWIDEGVRGGFGRNLAGGRLRSVGIGPDKIGREYRQYRTFCTLESIEKAEKAEQDHNHSLFGMFNLGGFANRKMQCAVTGARASYVGLIRPSTPEELAVICGCEVKDLPDVLQHWTLHDDYIGNHILNRIDPMNWHAHNPWQKLKLALCIPLSIRGLAKVKAGKAGLPPLDNIVDAAAVNPHEHLKTESNV